ncbi:hypothetical protein RF11_12213 [Thelohanellus kitauei]|uniref:Uncharacterized protein n=1 Tax=Thelohanellus kitauei TaxID=669202 RepID=A0A0C2NI37_THEKT|nr:hypothetical protein RF11_12213 [Thelohanellus kitauei]
MESSFSSKYYDSGLEKLVKYGQKHGVKRLLTKLKYEYAKHLFKAYGLKQAFPFVLQAVMIYSINHECLDLIELRCVCVCILAMLKKEAKVSKLNDDFYDHSQECGQPSQDLTVKTLWKCLHNRNNEKLIDTLKRLITKKKISLQVAEEPGTEKINEDTSKEVVIGDPATNNLVEDPVTGPDIQNSGSEQRRD